MALKTGATLSLSMLVLLIGCDRPALQTGATCALNSECESPLVCQLERCRRQCVDSRDCAAGLRCLSIGSLGGACQLPSESVCTLSSECTPGLVCRFGTCTTECVEDRDCPPGASCTLEGESGAMACQESLPELCIYNSDCDVDKVCNEDQQCVYECLSDRDCDDDRRCEFPFCVWRTDGG